MNNRTRKNQINIYFSDDEIILLREKAKLSGAKSVSAYIRNLVIYGFTFDIDYKELHDYSVALSRINNSLNQIAKKANESGYIGNADIKKSKELMDKIWHTHESMLLKQPLVNR